MNHLKHFIRENDKSYLNTDIGGTYAGSNYLQDNISSSDIASPTIENKTTRINYSLNTSFNSKINSHLFIKAGILAELLYVDLYYRNRENTADWIQIWDQVNQTALIQGYLHAKYSINDQLTLNLGVHSQHLALNSSNSVEPRVGIKYQLSKNSSLNAGYGMHSQMQPSDLYFYQYPDSNGQMQVTNKDLDFTRSQHFVVGYELLPFKDWRFKTNGS